MVQRRRFRWLSRCPRARPCRPRCESVAAAPKFVALGGGWLLHDASDDVRLAAVFRWSRGNHPRYVVFAALGFMGADLARDVFLGGCVHQRSLARYAPRPYQHGLTRGPGFVGVLHCQHHRHVRAQWFVWRCGVFRLHHHVCVFPAHRTLVRGAFA